MGAVPSQHRELGRLRPRRHRVSADHDHQLLSRLGRGCDGRCGWTYLARQHHHHAPHVWCRSLDRSRFRSTASPRAAADHHGHRLLPVDLLCWRQSLDLARPLSRREPLLSGGCGRLRRTPSRGEHARQPRTGRGNRQWLEQLRRAARSGTRLPRPARWWRIRDDLSVHGNRILAPGAPVLPLGEGAAPHGRACGASQRRPRCATGLGDDGSSRPLLPGSDRGFWLAAPSTPRPPTRSASSWASTSS